MKSPIWTTLIILFSLVAGTVGERASSYLLMVLVMIILMTTVTMVMIADELVKDVYFRWEKVLPKRVLFNLSL